MDEQILETFEKLEGIKTLTEFNNYASIVFKETKEYLDEIEKIPSKSVTNPLVAIFQRKKALGIICDINEYQKAEWQNYWLGCCVDKKCNYVFSILSAEFVDINREEDLIQIITGNVISKYLSREAKKYYLTVCIDFLLTRYNWVGAWSLFFKYPCTINLNLFKLFLPRLLSAILVGIIVIASSGDLMKFSEEMISSNYFYYFLLFAFLSYSFYFFLNVVG